MGKLTNNISTGVKNMAKAVQEGLTKASLALGAIGVGLTAYAKKSTDFTQDLVSNAKALQRQTGESINTSSKLLYVIQRMGGSADQAGSQFNFLVKQIQATRDQSSDAALKQEGLTNKIQAAKIEVARLTDEQKKNGDSSGVLKNKIEGLNITIKGYQQALNDAASPLDLLGVATQNADKSNRSFNDILLDVADKFKKMPDGVKKTNLALGLFGKSGGDMVKTLNLGRDGIIALEKKAEDLGLTLTNKTVGAITAYITSQKDLKDSTDGLKVQVGTLTAPVLTNFNNILTNMASAVLKSDSPLRGAVANIAAFGGPVATVSGGLIGFMANIFAISKGLGLFTTFILGSAAAIVGGGGLLVALGAMIGIDFGPFGKALSNAFGALVDWVNRSISSLSKLSSSPEWQGIKKVAQDVFDAATGYLKDFTTALQNGSINDALKNIKQKFDESIGKIGDALSKILDSAKSGDWKSVGDQIGTALSTALNKAMDGLSGLISNGLRKLDDVDWVGAGIALGKNVPALLIGLAAGLLNFDIGKLLKGVWDHLGDILLAALSLALLPAKFVGPIAKLLGKIPLAGTLLKWLFEGGVKVSKGAADALGKVAGAIGKGFGDALGLEAPKFIKAIGDFFNLLPTRIQLFALDAKNAVLKFAESIGGAIGDSIAPMVWKGEQFIAGLGNGIKSGFTKVADWLRGIGGRVTDAAGDLTQKLLGKGSDLLGGFFSGVKNGYTKVNNWIVGIQDRVWTAIGDTTGKLLSKGSNIISGFFSGAQRKFGEVTSWVRGIGGNVVRSVGDLGGKLWNAGSALIEGFLRGITHKFDDVKNYVGGIAKWIQDHKGPISYDRQLLVGAGQAIMAGFNEGLASGFKNVQSTVLGMNASLAGSFSSPSLNFAASGSSSSAITRQTSGVSPQSMGPGGRTVSVGQIVINNGGDYNRMLSDIGFQLELAS